MLISDIHVDSSFNCRAAILAHDVSDLAESIKESGQLQPVVVTPFKGNKPFKLIAGFRRFSAISQVLKRTEIDATVIKCTDDEARHINLTENLERKSLNCLEEAIGLEAAFPESLFSCRAAALKVKRTTAFVLSRRKLLTLDHETQLLFASGRIPISRVSNIANAPDRASAVKSFLKRSHVRQPCEQIRKRTVKEMNQMIIRLHESLLSGLATRCLAWAAGHVATDDLISDIDQCVKEGKS